MRCWHAGPRTHTVTGQCGEGCGKKRAVKTNCLNNPVQRSSLVTSLAGSIFFVFGSSVHFSSEPSHLFLNFAWRLSYPPVDTGLRTMSPRDSPSFERTEAPNEPTKTFCPEHSLCRCVGRCVGLSVCQSGCPLMCVGMCVWKGPRCTEDELAQTRRRACSQ